ncbi:hypothetical protein DFQ26_007069 [Actinomortierella ambigua]|nr:hypothetical protein DFQ26_007069 [Actinomortierella ambigua]
MAYTTSALTNSIIIGSQVHIPEVCLYFSNKLLGGNRSLKMDAVDFNAFERPSIRPLVNVAINIVMSPNVGSLRLFPGITESTIRAFLAPPIQGVVLETISSVMKMAGSTTTTDHGGEARQL